MAAKGQASGYNIPPGQMREQLQRRANELMEAARALQAQEDAIFPGGRSPLPPVCVPTLGHIAMTPQGRRFADSILQSGLDAAAEQLEKRRAQLRQLQPRVGGGIAGQAGIQQYARTTRRRLPIEDMVRASIIAKIPALHEAMKAAEERKRWLIEQQEAQRQHEERMRAIKKSGDSGCVIYSYLFGPRSAAKRYATVYCGKYMTVNQYLGYYDLGKFLVGLCEKWFPVHYFVKYQLAVPWLRGMLHVLGRWPQLSVKDKIICRTAFHIFKLIGRLHKALGVKTTGNGCMTALERLKSRSSE